MDLFESRLYKPLNLLTVCLFIRENKALAKINTDFRQVATFFVLHSCLGDWNHFPRGYNYIL